MLQSHLGELVAVLTAVLWAFTSLSFAVASRRVGPQAVNRLRLLLAIPFLSLAHLFVRGSLLPDGIGLERWFWLALSALSGLVVGDTLLFYAYAKIGPRLSMLLMAAVPVLSTLLGWVVLKERLDITQLIAIFITVVAIEWVVLEHRPADVSSQTRPSVSGIISGLGAAFSQALGLILSKQGMSGDFPALSASIIRVATAASIVWATAALQRRAGSTLKLLHDALTRRSILAGTILGPVLGMTMSLVAVQLSEVGIASTLMALSPVLLLPMTHWQLQERITLRGVTGTLGAMLGVAILLLL